MNQRLTPATAFLLTVPPLMWAGNAVVGRLLQGLVPPVTLNFLRWVLAAALLLPLASWVLRADSPLWGHARRFAALGLLGVGCYNALQYLALKTSTPLNVTLVAASSPVFMLAIGAVFFGHKPVPRQYLGAALSIAGVLVVLSRGDWDVLLQVRLVFGLGWSGLFAAGEWALGAAPIQWGWPLVAALAFVAVGPAILAYRCWGLGVQRVGPNLAGFFANLTPLFAALMSAAFLGEWPHAYHAVGFVLIVGGIVASSRR